MVPDSVAPNWTVLQCCYITVVDAGLYNNAVLVPDLERKKKIESGKGWALPIFKEYFGTLFQEVSYYVAR